MKSNLLILLLCFLCGAQQAPTDIAWKTLDSGLEYAAVKSTVASSHGNSTIDVLRFDPKKFKLNLICAGEKKVSSQKLDVWCQQHKALAGVNAGMFKLDGNYNTCTGYMKNFKYLNNPTLNPSYNTVLAFNAKDSTVPAAQLIDMRCQSWAVLKDKYNSFAQGIRMMDCNANNTWQYQEKKWSMVTIGEDAKGNILFVFTRSPYRVYDFVNIIKALPLDMKKMMYLEGGPEASMYVSAADFNLRRFGSYETGFNENDNNSVYWDIPNVLAITKK